MAERDALDRQTGGHRERMRRRLLEGGGEGFHDYELLEYVLALAIPRRDTKPLAKRLLAEFGDLSALLAARPEELARVEGLGEGAVAALKFVEACATRALKRRAVARPVLSSLDLVVDWLHARLAHEVAEEFMVLFLDNRNMLIRAEAMGRGTVNQAAVYPREVVRLALLLQASAIILVHNHPSGDPTPSQDDVAITRTIMAALRTVEIKVHDHLVIGRTGHASLRAAGLM